MMKKPTASERKRMANKDEKKKTQVKLTDHLVMIGVGLGIFYWIFEAFFNIFLAKSGLNPFQLFTIPSRPLDNSLLQS